MGSAKGQQIQLFRADRVASLSPVLRKWQEGRAYEWMRNLTVSAADGAHVRFTRMQYEIKGVASFGSSCVCATRGYQADGHARSQTARTDLNLTKIVILKERKVDDNDSDHKHKHDH